MIRAWVEQQFFFYKWRKFLIYEIKSRTRLYISFFYHIIAYDHQFFNFL